MTDNAYERLSNLLISSMDKLDALIDDGTIEMSEELLKSLRELDGEIVKEHENGLNLELKADEIDDNWYFKNRQLDLEFEKLKLEYELKNKQEDYNYILKCKEFEATEKKAKKIKIRPLKLPELSDTDKRVVGDLVVHTISAGAVVGTTLLAIYADETGLIPSNLALRLIPKIRV